jgi:hypothetical protein
VADLGRNLGICELVSRFNAHDTLTWVFRFRTFCELALGLSLALSHVNRSFAFPLRPLDDRSFPVINPSIGFSAPVRPL